MSQDFDPTYIYQPRDITTILKGAGINTLPVIAIEDHKLLENYLRIGIARALFSSDPAALPVTINKDQYAGFLFNKQKDGKIQIIYYDPSGTPITNYVSTIQNIIQSVDKTSNFVDLQYKQQSDIKDSGPLIIESLASLGSTADLESIPKAVIVKGLLENSKQIYTIRQEHTKQYKELKLSKQLTYHQQKADFLTSPTQPTEIDPLFRRLDSIARLITGGNICSAVSFDGKDILVSNNNNASNNLTKEFFDFFGDITKKNLTTDQILQDQTIIDKMRELVEKSFNDYLTNHYKYQEAANSLQGLIDANQKVINTSSHYVMDKATQGLLTTGKSSLEKELSKTPPLMIAKTKELQQQISTINNALHTDNKDQVINSLKITHQFYLKKLEDTDQVIKLREDLTRDLEKVVSSLATDCDPRSKFPDEFKQALINGFQDRVGVYSEDKKGILFLNNPQGGVHAEMTVMERLISKNGNIISFDPEVKAGKKSQYIGITKLCCNDCHYTIKAYNKLKPVQAQITPASEMPDSFLTRGTHFKRYTWIEPKFIKRVDGIIEDQRVTLSKLKSDIAHSDPFHIPRLERADNSPSPSLLECKRSLIRYQELTSGSPASTTTTAAQSQPGAFTTATIARLAQPASAPPVTPAKRKAQGPPTP